MAEVYDFFVKQISGVYPQVSGSKCRLSRIRVLRFPGHAINDLILYQVEVQASEGAAWELVRTKVTQDMNWFGFIRKPTDIATDRLLSTCHRHFMSQVLNNQVSFKIIEYLALYKRETIYPMQMTMKDGRQVEYWDTMLVRALELKEDTDYTEQTYGSVKIRERWLIGKPQPEEPYRSGVLFSYPLSEPTLEAAQAKVGTVGRNPSVFTKCKPLSGSSLEVFHSISPEIST